MTHAVRLDCLPSQSPHCSYKSTTTWNITRRHVFKIFPQFQFWVTIHIAVGGEGSEGNHCPLQQGTYMKEFMHLAQGIISYYHI